MAYDIGEFINEQIGRDKEQILRALEWEILRTDYRLKGTRRVQARVAGAVEYRRTLAGMSLLLRTGLLPRVAAEPIFMGLQPLCADLVTRGLLDQRVLTAFSAPDALAKIS